MTLFEIAYLALASRSTSFDTQGLSSEGLPVGDIAISDGVIEAARCSPQLWLDLGDILDRFASGDWGLEDPALVEIDHAVINDNTVRAGFGDIVALYTIGDADKGTLEDIVFWKSADSQRVYVSAFDELFPDATEVSAAVPRAIGRVKASASLLELVGRDMGAYGFIDAGLREIGASIVTGPVQIRAEIDIPKRFSVLAMQAGADNAQLKVEVVIGPDTQGDIETTISFVGE